MINFEKELEAILADDPLGLLEVKPKASAVMNADARLIASFEEINAFVEEYGREPAKSQVVNERRLFSRLKGLRENPVKAAALAEFDRFNLLPRPPEPKTVESIDDVLDDVLGLLGDNEFDDEEANSIFMFTHTPEAANVPEYIAKRRRCAEFEQFEPLFKQVHTGLATKKKKMVAFTSDKQIAPNTFFILQGSLVYVATVGEWEKRKHHNDARLYCIYENGTESHVLLRSLAGSLWKDENGGYQVVDVDQMELFDESTRVTAEDEATGIIYILRSLSNDPQIKSIKDLYKIGYSTQPVQERIKNAAQDPTYLMADVVIITEFETFNLNLQKLELLLHRFFAESCLNFDIFDGTGKRHSPREWFIVPLPIIEAAIHLLISGEIVNYRYDGQAGEIVGR